MKLEPEFVAEPDVPEAAALEQVLPDDKSDLEEQESTPAPIVLCPDGHVRCPAPAGCVPRTDLCRTVGECVSGTAEQLCPRLQVADSATTGALEEILPEIGELLGF